MKSLSNSTRRYYYVTFLCVITLKWWIYEWSLGLTIVPVCFLSAHCENWPFEVKTQFVEKVFKCKALDHLGLKRTSSVVDGSYCNTLDGCYQVCSSTF